MDGYETATRLRERPNGSDLYIVALTGWGQQVDRERSASVGIDEHLVKPAEVDAIDEIVERRLLRKNPAN